MKINFIIPQNNFMANLIPELQKLSYEFGEDNPDIIIGMSISQMKRIKEAHQRNPDIPMINYNWDIYEWVWSHPTGKNYDYPGYGKLLKESKEVWCPSECTVKRLKEWFNLDNGIVIKTFAQYFDMNEITDERYVFNPLRLIPDRNRGLFEKACNELKIPFKNKKEGNFSWEEYKKVLAECSFVVSPYYEASTGGLSVLEGYYLGKPVLVSDSPYCGARDYFGDRAYYFKHDSYDDLKKQIKFLWEDTPKLDLKECQRFVKENYSASNMSKKIDERLKKL